MDAAARTKWGRCFADLVSMHVSDLGGPETLSEAQRSLIRRAATIEVELEQAEGMLSGGRRIDITNYAAVAGHLAAFSRCSGSSASRAT